MKRTFLRITSVALVLLLLFAASGCTTEGKIHLPTGAATTAAKTEPLVIPESKYIETPEDVEQEMLALAEKALQNVPFEKMTVSQFFEYAKKGDFVVTKKRELLSGKDVWQSFLKEAAAKSICTVKCIDFSEVLVPEGDLPSVHFLHYDGEYYRTIRYYPSKPEKSYVLTWKYFLSDNFIEQDEGGTYTCDVYYVVNHPDITYEHIEASFAITSQSHVWFVSIIYAKRAE